ncbi:MAG: glycoside hydrolase family 32 protein [Atopobiaceae bacterium]|nr:glycoside hydrolase family 32 protein [Atopobiaceae bacterium]
MPDRNDLSRYRLSFHIAPEHGWLNDPNGLCQFRGQYHAFYQYNPLWPQKDTKHWRHVVSADLVHWHDEGTALVTDIPEDRSGVYSGSALIVPCAASDGGDLMCLYYTGNVVYPGGKEAGYDYVHTGREANEILVTTEDGQTYSEKRVLLRNDDYPDVCTQHVRDPKVWEQAGAAYVLLGARNLDDVGFCLLYESADGIEWRLRSQIRSREKLGYMWECPNIVQLGGHDFLAICPQGLEEQELCWQNKNQAGYIPLTESVLDATVVDGDAFVEWDHGYDFYAPQVFVDDAGRQILIGWMGSFGDPWTAAPRGLDWCHCLTVPRELTIGADGLLRQLPVAEYDALRKECVELAPGVAHSFADHRLDIVLAGIKGEGCLTLDGALELACADGKLSVRFLDEEVTAGRPARSVLLDSLKDLRILVDTSAVEIYANGGSTVFSTRWFPTAEQLSVRHTFDVSQAEAYLLEDALENVFA